MQDNDPVVPERAPSAGHSWRERFHSALNSKLDPETVILSLIDRLPEDPVGVFKAIAATLPKELDVRSEPQTHHLFLLRLVGQAQERGIDLHALIDGPLVGTTVIEGEISSDNARPEWLR